MKRRLHYLFAVVAILIVFNNRAVCQSNSLEFNQVKLVGSTVETVPTGKVWKVESIMAGTAADFRNGYKIQVNGTDVYLNTYNSGPKYWSNIVSILFEAKTTTSCSGTWTPYFVFSGYEGGFPVISRSTALTSFSSTSWTTIGTIVPSIANTQLEISAMQFYCTNTGTAPWSPWSMRMTVTYSDGTVQQSPLYNYSSGTSCTNWSSSSMYVIGSSATPYSVSATSRDNYILPTQLPMWLPEGTTLKTAGSNIPYINVVEFNVAP